MSPPSVDMSAPDMILGSSTRPANSPSTAGSIAAVSAALLYILFFFSGISGLVYQVVWVRAFGLVFGNNVYSSASVIAIFMLGLGVGSYVAGLWADRRYAENPHSLLAAYSY